MMMKKNLPFLIIFMLVSYCSFGQVDTTGGGKFTMSGYIDSYYLTGFNNPKSGNFMGFGNDRTGQQRSADAATKTGSGGPVGRAFDRLDKQFALGLVQTKFMYTNAKSEMVIDLTFGPNAELGNFGNTRGTTNLNSVTGSNYQNQLYGTSAAIKQAYFTYKFTSKFSMTAGQFGTHIGYEVIDAPINYHYSLSNLFNNGPFYHVGLKATYAFSDHVTLMAGIVNNWDNLTDTKTQKSLISQLYIKPVDGWNIYINWIGGYSDDTYITSLANPVTANYTRNLFDLTTGYQITPKFYLGLNAAYGFYKFKTNNAVDEASIISSYDKTSPSWGGIAGYANYAISDMVGIGVRYEHFEDKHYVRYIGTVNNSLTITAPITLAAGKLIVKPEFRHDTSPDKYYEDKDGKGTNSQNTLGVAFIYKY